MSCATDWTKRTIKGIIICTDKYRKSAEIGISAETNKNYDKYNSLSKTSAGFSKIQDDELFPNPNSLGDGDPCAGCSIIGTPITNSKITLFIDVSLSTFLNEIRFRILLI